HHAAGRRDRGPLRGDLVGHVEHGHVHPVEHLRGQRQDLDLGAADPQVPARGPGRGDQPDLTPHVVAGGQQVEHDRADGAGRAHHGQRRLGRPGPAAHRPVPPYTTASTSLASRSKARCAAVTAMSTSFWSTTTEILISEVEIISMLTAASASAPKKVALTPGWERMPAPISDTLPIRSS